MGTDQGVDLSRRAIRAARTDLQEALRILSPGRENGGTATPASTVTTTASQLSGDLEAMGGYWPAAMSFHESTRNGITAVTSSYDSIVIQLENAIDLLRQALDNYDGAEGDSSDRSQTAQI
ncbi:hypothetical protein ACFOY2_51165 [Nonomuraea purpurea]|uniref:PE domain-containing protein n=1 Tax=Nonomuraea purpurea TaxID=1849276 RepID=A0ABV8GPP1_9ACTN